MGRVPLSWKESNTILIHKGGERDDLGNWRPLSLGNTVAKLYAAILADRVTVWATKTKNISPEQKRFLRNEGCLEHNFLLQSAIGDSRRNNKQLCVAWLDLANAFGSVPHQHILNAMRTMGMPERMVNVVRDMYVGSTTRAPTSEGLLEPIPIGAGVK